MEKALGLETSHVKLKDTGLLIQNYVKERGNQEFLELVRGKLVPTTTGKQITGHR